MRVLQLRTFSPCSPKEEIFKNSASGQAGVGLDVQDACVTYSLAQKKFNVPVKGLLMVQGRLLRAGYQDPSRRDRIFSANEQKTENLFLQFFMLWKRARQALKKN